MAGQPRNAANIVNSTIEEYNKSRKPYTGEIRPTDSKAPRVRVWADPKCFDVVVERGTVEQMIEKLKFKYPDFKIEKR